MIINMVYKFIRMLKVLNNFLRKKEKKRKIKKYLEIIFRIQELKNFRIQFIKYLDYLHEHLIYKSLRKQNRA